MSGLNRQVERFEVWQDPVEPAGNQLDRFLIRLQSELSEIATEMEMLAERKDRVACEEKLPSLLLEIGRVEGVFADYMSEEQSQSGLSTRAAEITTPRE